MPNNFQRASFAIRGGNLERLRDLIAKGTLSELTSLEGENVLHVAAQEGYPEAIELLLNAGMSVMCRTTDGKTPLHCVVTRGGGFFATGKCSRLNRALEAAFMQIMKMRNKSIPPETTIDADFDSPGADAVFDAFWDLYADKAALKRDLLAIGFDLESLDRKSREFVEDYPSYLPAARLLLDRGADVDATDKWGTTPLQEAAERERIDLINLFLDRGADVNRQSTGKGFSETPISLAIDHHQVAAAKLLCERGARLDVGYPFLQSAAFNGRCEMVLWLLSKGVDVNQRSDDGSTPLMTALQNAQYEVARILLAHGADPKIATDKGATILHVAAWDLPSLTVALKQGLSLEARDDTGKTPLHRAADFGMPGCIQLLLKHGADINAKDADGNTPLHCSFSSEELRPDVEFPGFHALVAAGADRGARNKEGKTARDMAVNYNYPEEYWRLLDSNSTEEFLCINEALYPGFSCKAELPVTIDGMIWPNSHRYFEAQKYRDPEVREKIRECKSTSKMRDFIHENGLIPRADWAVDRDGTMRKALFARFQQYPELRRKLIGTGTATLVIDSFAEGYWTEGRDLPLNAIGLMLMSIREELRK